MSGSTLRECLTRKEAITFDFSYRASELTLSLVTMSVIDSNHLKGPLWLIEVVFCSYRFLKRNDQGTFFVGGEPSSTIEETKD